MCALVITTYISNKGQPSNDGVYDILLIEMSSPNNFIQIIKCIQLQILYTPATLIYLHLLID